MSSAESLGTSSDCDRIAETDRDTECDRQSTYDPCVSECDPEYDFSESEDVDMYFDSDDMTGGPHTVSPVLMNDIRLLKETYPQSNCVYRCLDSLNEMELDISFPTTILEKTTAQAWGFIHGEPVVIRLCLNQRSYLNVEGVGRIVVSQKGCTTSGVLMQLKRIVEEFCKIQFRNLTNEKVQAELESIPPDISLRNRGESEAATSDARNTPLLPRDGKEIPSLSRGFLVQLYIYIDRRLLTLNRFCPVCDNCHCDALCLMLKPTVCSNRLCIFAHHAFGITAGAADTVIHEPQVNSGSSAFDIQVDSSELRYEVIHLLICLTKAAVNSLRNKIIFEPYPTIVDPNNDNEFVIHPGKKDYALIREILDKLPDIQEMLKYKDAELKKILQQEHELCYPLLRWIISSNRSYIVKLPLKQQLTFMGTRHQFLLRNSPPLQDQRFRENKSKHGSLFAFHGSPIENWHSIIREGLIVASNTKKQLHGRAHGVGIYLTPSLQLAVNYTGRYEIIRPTYKQKKQSNQALEEEEEFIEGIPEQFACIALCEVINCDSLKKNVSDIWTCDQSEYVCTRFFFLYNKSAPSLHSYVSTMTPEISKEIESTLAAEG